MTIFLRLLEDQDKASSLEQIVRTPTTNFYDVDLRVFKKIPGCPFSYWASDTVIELFARLRRNNTNNSKAYSGGKNTR